MKNVMITGATSFIGIHLIKKYLEKGYNVTAVVRPKSNNLERIPKCKTLNILEVDMTQIENVVELVDDRKYDIFYHLAWEGARAPYRDDVQIQEGNYKCALKAIEVARQLNCKVFIGTGSQAEYGKCIGKISEEYRTEPVTEYGKAKLRAYEALKNIAQQYNIKFIWTRIFSVYGVYDYSGTLVMSALNKMIKNEDLELTECKQNWDFIHVEDVASAMYLLGNSECEAGVYNIASGQSKILKEFVFEMKEICQSKSELKFGVVPYAQEGPVSFEPIVDKLKQNLEWKPQISFSEGVKKILKFIS